MSAKKTRINARADYAAGDYIQAGVIVKGGETIEAATQRVLAKLDSLARKYPRKAIPTFTVEVSQ